MALTKLNTRSLPDNAITTAKIANNAVNDAKFDAANASLSTILDPVSASGSSVLYLTGIPTTATRVTLTWYYLSQSSTTQILMRLGHAGGLFTSGYYTKRGDIYDSGNSGGSYDNNENYLALDDWTNAANQFVGTYEFTAFDQTSTNRIWHYRSQIFNPAYTQYVIFVTGNVSCGDKSSTPLSRIAVYTADGANFDTGTLQLKYS